MFGLSSSDHDTTQDNAQATMSDQADYHMANDQVMQPMSNDGMNLPVVTQQDNDDSQNMTVASEQSADTTSIDTPSTSEGTAISVKTEVPEEDNSSRIDIASNGTMNNMSALKQQALQELSPLIDKLDQSPDERYEIAKMIYEETKDKNMLTTVYEAAKNLTDERKKAQAIYDIIKKINTEN